MNPDNPALTAHPAGGRGLDQLIALAGAQPLALPPALERFHFLRHGQTPRNALRIFQGVDEPLSELGLAQAARAAATLAAVSLRSLPCSDARRALQTAQAVAAVQGLAPQPTAVLRERNFGALIGTSSAQLDWACDPEGGESLARFVVRTRVALQQALALPGPVLVVAHGGTLHVLAAALGLAAEPALLGNAHPLCFRRIGPRWQVDALQPPADAQGAALA